MKLSTALKNLIGKTLLYVVLIDLAFGLMRAIQIRLNLFPTIDREIISLYIPFCLTFLICFLLRHELKWFRHLNKSDKRWLSKNSIFKLANDIEGGGDRRMGMWSLIIIMSLATFMMTSFINFEDSPETNCKLLLYIAIVLAVGNILLLLSGWRAGIMHEQAMIKEQKDDEETKEFILKIITFPFRIIYKKIKGEEAPAKKREQKGDKKKRK